MATSGITSKPGKARLGTLSTIEKVGWTISGLLIAFLLVGGIIDVVRTDKSESVIVADLGYPESTVVWIGIALVICAVLYAIPRTALLGAILLTGYFGGATATNVRLEEPWFVMPVAVGVLVWVALALRDAGARAFFQQSLGIR